MLYRYLERRWADDLVRGGGILLRPLTYYQHGNPGDLARHRPAEGTITRRSFVPLAGGDALRTMPFESSILRSFGAERVVVDRCEFHRTVTASRCWAYCVSRRHSAELYRHFDADACVEIHDPQRFFSAIAGALGRDCIGFEYNDCDPSGRVFPAYEVDDSHAIYAKEAEDIVQAEVRAVFHAAGGVLLSDRSLRVPELRAYCRHAEKPRS